MKNRGLKVVRSASEVEHQDMMLSKVQGCQETSGEYDLTTNFLNPMQEIAKLGDLKAKGLITARFVFY